MVADLEHYVRRVVANITNRSARIRATYCRIVAWLKSKDWIFLYRQRNAQSVPNQSPFL
jgi:hypothetical protein